MTLLFLDETANEQNFARLKGVLGLRR